MTDDFKVCPYCAETIKVAAIFCKHCRSDLSLRTKAELEAQSVAYTPPLPPDVKLAATAAAPSDIRNTTGFICKKCNRLNQATQQLCRHCNYPLFERAEREEFQKNSTSDETRLLVHIITVVIAILMIWGLLSLFLPLMAFWKVR